MNITGDTDNQYNKTISQPNIPFAGGNDVFAVGKVVPVVGAVAFDEKWKNRLQNVSQTADY